MEENLSLIILELKSWLNKPNADFESDIKDLFFKAQRVYYQHSKKVDIDLLIKLEDCVDLIFERHNPNEFIDVVLFILTIFKFNDKADSISFHLSEIPNLPLQQRLKAFVLVRRVEDIRKDLFEQWETYLQLLESAEELSSEDISSDIVNDIYDFYKWGYKKLQGEEYKDELAKFKSQFITDVYINKYSILREPLLNKLLADQASIDIQIEDKEYSIYQPSQLMHVFFQESVVNTVRNLPNTYFPDTIIGYHKSVIRQDILEYGLANFDQDYDKSISAEIRIKLYNYFNLRKHYFTLYHVFEKINVTKMFDGFQPLVVDIGSGPGTAALVLSDFLLSQQNRKSFNYLGIDISSKMNTNARNNIESFTNGGLELSLDFATQFTADKTFQCIGKSNSIIFIASYLFASKSLDELELAQQINKVLMDHTNIPILFLFQNTQEHSRNAKYESFKNNVPNLLTLLTGMDTIYYKNFRNSLYEPSSEPVYFELLGNSKVRLT